MTVLQDILLDFNQFVTEDRAKNAKGIVEPYTKSAHFTSHMALEAIHPKESYAVEQCPLSIPDAESVVFSSNVTK